MPLNLEKEVVVGLVGEHERGPAVMVVLLPLVLSFVAAEENFSGCFADV